MARGVCGVAVAFVIAAWGAFCTGIPAAAQVTPGVGKALKSIEAEFGVKVLKVRPVTVNGRAAFEATVMNPAGNYNEAFQVNRLVIDAATGELIQQVRHGAVGYTRSAEAPGAEGFEGEDIGPAVRRKSTVP